MKLHIINLLQINNNNVHQARKDIGQLFRGSLNAIMDLLLYIPFQEPLALSPPHSNALETLILFPYQVSFSVWNEKKKRSFRKESSVELKEKISDRLIESLTISIRCLVPVDMSIDNDKTNKHHIDAILPLPINILTIAASSSEYLRCYISKKLLPTQNQVKSPQFKTEPSLASYLYRFMISKMQPKTREAVYDLFLALLKDDGEKKFISVCILYSIIMSFFFFCVCVNM